MSRIALSLYSLIIYLARPLALLGMVWRSKADPAYRQRFSERLAWQQIPIAARGGVVVHAVSMGEVVAAIPLIKKLMAQNPKLPITVTCTTPTGSERIKAAFGDSVYHCYLPFDTPGAVKRFLNKLQPQMLVLLETELWPNLIWQAHARQIVVQLVNARLSAKSAKGYQSFAFIVQPMLARIRAVYCQDAASTERFLALGAQAQTAGNLKFDMQIAPNLQERAVVLAEQWQLGVISGGRPVLVAGSTHAGEDEQVLAAFQQVTAQVPTALLILVPRHPDRFEQVSQLISEAGFSQARRSQDGQVTADTQVLLGDTMGELMLWYQLADLIFIGGSLITRGGHNPLEAMCLAKPVISGRHIFNFAEVYANLQQASAVVWVDDAASLAEVVLDLFANPSKRQQLANAGFALYQQHGGATARLSTAMQPWLSPLSCQTVDQHELWLQPELVTVNPNRLFDITYWQEQQAVTGQSTGRNTVWFVRQEQQEWVMRHYYRGGFIGKLLTDWFWPEAIAQSRAMAEFTMLRQMSALDLPVPTAIAARMVKHSFGYSADIMIARIAGSRDLFAHLQQQPLRAEQWQALGKLIARFHRAGVYHSDLNCHNILLDDKQFWLIDFDKCGWSVAPKAQQEMLDRLLRSLHKEQQKATLQGQSFYFSPADFDILLAAYAASE